MKKRVYGNENTMIRLTDKAQKFYDGSSPFHIFEYEDDAGHLTYSFAGFGDPETDRMTAEELIRNLEAMADAMDEEEDEDDDPLWYAAMKDADDTDWGTGSHDRAEAIQKARDLRDCGYYDAYVAIISDGPDPVCIGELHDLDD